MCHYAHYQKYVEGLRKKKIKRPFMFGRIVHEMVEAEANGDNPFQVLDNIDLTNKKLFRAEQEMYGDIIEDIRCIMQEYFEFWKKSGFTYVRKKGKSAEHAFEIEVEKGIVYKGKIDGFGKHNGLKWLVEHKTFTREMNDDDRWRNIQSAVYIWAVRELGLFDPDGTMWDYVKSKPPTVPQLLKDGTMSQRAIDSLPSVVNKFLKENQLKPTKYKEFLEQQKGNREKFFKRVFTPISEDVIQMIWGDFMESAREIAEFGEEKQTRNIGFHCKTCDFEALCRAELQGLDVDFVRSREYTTDAEESLQGEDREDA